MTQTIGQKLKAIREEKQLTLEKVFQATRIRVPYLRALEDDDLSSMPSPVQARGYLRNYAEYLGLDIDQLLEEVRSQPSVEGIIGPADLTPQPAVSTLKPLPVQDASTTLSSTPLFPPTVDSIQEVEPTPEPTPTKPKRRGRKKVEPESEPIPEPIQVVEPQPESIEEPVIPEPVLDDRTESVQEESQPDVSDNLWQSWLNRISSVISTRTNRKTEAQDVPAPAEEVEASEPSEPPQLPIDATRPIPRSGSVQRSDEIFKEIGFQLRNRRETLSLHLAEVERNTHVKAHYLEALEEGAMDRLPSTV